jgi:uncharacterized protein YndB with AHSA1/START domain
MNSNRIERKIELKAPVPRVWRALTDYREFGTWFHVDLEGPFKVGQEVNGRLTIPDFTHPISLKIVAIEAMTYFAYTWHPYPFDPALDYSKEEPTLVEFRLEPAAGGSQLTVSESGFDRIPASRRPEAFRMHDGGWEDQLSNISSYVAAS